MEGLQFPSSLKGLLVLAVEEYVFPNRLFPFLGEFSSENPARLLLRGRGKNTFTFCRLTQERDDMPGGGKKLGAGVSS